MALRTLGLFAAALTSAALASPHQLNLHYGTAKDWPALRFKFSVKRSSMQIHGQSDFTMFADPVVSNDIASVQYDTFSTFTENSVAFNYTVFNGVSYVSHRAMNDKSSSPGWNAQAQISYRQ
ncbi:hypothetical protein GN244_ATG01642 [Phytophthora infestans]|uniref:Glycoside hydrolase 131 catalytic N-terminal domain-containing protein n=1 Tax=Phytophthora infestans TaxID=4787 RepID=A0A833TLE7_PHYIN|nr:hypothetical protein GN244_ATG01642 [Phytophthora infestans]